MEQESSEVSARRKVINTVCWVVIAVLAAATLWAVQWASHQPAVHSIWGERSEKPIT